MSGQQPPASLLALTVASVTVNPVAPNLALTTTAAEGGSVASASSTEQAVAGSSTALWQLGAWSACSADCLQVRGVLGGGVVGAGRGGPGQ